MSGTSSNKTVCSMDIILIKTGQSGHPYTSKDIRFCIDSISSTYMYIVYNYIITIIITIPKWWNSLRRETFEIQTHGFYFFHRSSIMYIIIHIQHKATYLVLIRWSVKGTNKMDSLYKTYKLELRVWNVNFATCGLFPYGLFPYRSIQDQRQ